MSRAGSGRQQSLTPTACAPLGSGGGRSVSSVMRGMSGRMMMLTGSKTAKSITPKAGFCMAVYRNVSQCSHFRVSQAMVERKVGTPPTSRFAKRHGRFRCGFEVPHEASTLSPPPAPPALPLAPRPHPVPTSLLRTIVKDAKIGCRGSRGVSYHFWG